VTRVVLAAAAVVSLTVAEAPRPVPGWRPAAEGG
jgi:hypothetical protein